MLVPWKSNPTKGILLTSQAEMSDEFGEASPTFHHSRLFSGEKPDNLAKAKSEQHISWICSWGQILLRLLNSRVFVDG